MSTYTLQAHARDVQAGILGDIGRHTGYDLIERDDAGKIISIQSIDLTVSGNLGFQKIEFYTQKYENELPVLSNGQHWPTKIEINGEMMDVNDDLAEEYKFKTATLGEGDYFKEIFERMKLVANICNQFGSVTGGLINYGPLNGPNCNTFTNYFNNKFIHNSQLWNMLSYDGTSEFVGSDKDLFECCAAEDKKNLVKMDYLIDQFISKSDWQFDYSTSYSNIQPNEYGWTLNIGNDKSNYIFDDDSNCEIVDGDRNSYIYAGNGLNIINAGGGNDTIYGGKDEDRIHGGDGDDYIDAGDGNDLIYGGAGNNRIYAGGGDDEIHGGNGHDEIYGGDGNDTIYGGDGTYMIYGGDGDDIIHGEKGEGFINAGSGINHIYLPEKGYSQVQLNNMAGGIDYIYNARVNYISYHYTLELESQEFVGHDVIYTFTNGAKAIAYDAYYTDENNAADQLIQAMSTFGADGSNGIDTLSSDPTASVQDMYNLACSSDLSKRAA